MYIYQFEPTFLYIKQHSITGKLYFGKTVKNPETYQGSGKHWLRHIKTHGKEHVITLWYCIFLERETCTEFALNFSKQQNIVESDDWLNLQHENGLDGGVIGHKRGAPTYETRMKISASNMGHKVSEEQRQKLLKINLTKVTCPHCGVSGGKPPMMRFHFNKCKTLKS